MVLDGFLIMDKPQGWTLAAMDEINKRIIPPQKLKGGG